MKRYIKAFAALLGELTRRTAVTRYTKAIAAMLGGLTPPAVIGLAHLAGWSLDLQTAAVLVGILSPLAAGIATWRAPANTPPA